MNKHAAAGGRDLLVAGAAPHALEERAAGDHLWRVHGPEQGRQGAPPPSFRPCLGPGRLEVRGDGAQEAQVVAPEVNAARSEGQERARLTRVWQTHREREMQVVNKWARLFMSRDAHAGV